MQDSTDRAVMPLAEAPSVETHSPGGTAAPEIESWLVSYLANLLDIPETEVSRTLTFEQFGLDSAAAVAMTGDLARWLGKELSPNAASKHKTISALASHIAS